MPYLMGLDISTTGAKALIINETGGVIAVANTPQPIQPAQAALERAEPGRLVGRHRQEHSRGLGGIWLKGRGHQRHRFDGTDARSGPA